MTDTYTVKLEEDSNGSLILPIPTDLLNQMGWDLGDELIWEETMVCADYGEYNAYTLAKKKDYLEYEKGEEDESKTD